MLDGQYSEVRCEELLIAVLKRAVRDLEGENAELARAAWKWIYSPDADWICELLECDPFELRARVGVRLRKRREARRRSR